MEFHTGLVSHPLHVYRICSVSLKNYTEWCVFAVYAPIYLLLYAILTLLFAEVGITIGAISGAFGGSRSECGFLHGATVGASMGCILSIKILNFLMSTWATGCFLFLVETTSSLLKKRLAQRRSSPTIPVPGETQETVLQVHQDAVLIDRNGVPRLGFGSKKFGKMLTRKKIAKIILTDKNIVKTTWNGNCCSICLQDFLIGDVACRLPECYHMFHGACIGRWLIEHDSCPLCRLHL